ncbi:MAG: glycosyltransferase family 4 protein [Nitrososphaerales archaeon]
MKICLVNSYYHPWIGGAETYASNLAKGLAKRGHEVTVYCSDRPLHAGESLEDGIKVVRMRTPATFYGTPLVLFPPEIIVERYDVIHANFPSPYLAAVSALIAAARTTPAVLTWHNDLPPVTSGAGMLVGIHDAVSGSYLNGYRKIIATTYAYSKRSRLLSRYSDKVVVIQNGVNTTRFNPRVDGEVVRQRYGLGQSKVALFVGALTTWHAYKGVEVLLRAFKNASEKGGDIKLLIVGGGNMMGKYKSMAQELCISSSVVFAGKVSDEELPQYYAACDFSILPSKDLSEGFGLVLLEAMACGKAVIGSRVGGIVEVITEGVNGLLVEPNDVDSLARAIHALFEDDQKRAMMGRSGRTFAESHDWSAVARRVESLYKEIQ